MPDIQSTKISYCLTKMTFDFPPLYNYPLNVNGLRNTKPLCLSWVVPSSQHRGLSALLDLQIEFRH